MASKGRMEELAERKCVFNWKFSCDNKSERLIEAGTEFRTLLDVAGSTMTMYTFRCRKNLRIMLT